MSALGSIPGILFSNSAGPLSQILQLAMKTAATAPSNNSAGPNSAAGAGNGSSSFLSTMNQLGQDLMKGNLVAAQGDFTSLPSSLFSNSQSTNSPTGASCTSPASSRPSPSLVATENQQSASKLAWRAYQSLRNSFTADASGSPMITNACGISVQI